MLQVIVITIHSIFYRRLEYLFRHLKVYHETTPLRIPFLRVGESHTCCKRNAEYRTTFSRFPFDQWLDVFGSFAFWLNSPTVLLKLASFRNVEVEIIGNISWSRTTRTKWSLRAALSNDVADSRRHCLSSRQHAFFRALQRPFCWFDRMVIHREPSLRASDIRHINILWCKGSPLHSLELRAK